MNQVVLDTNALAMVLTDDSRLPHQCKQDILAAASVSVSAISFYEIGQKVRLGKWPEMAPFAPDLVNIVQNDGMNMIPLSSQQAMTAALLDWNHRDPFDRMIAAVVMSEDAKLVSSDEEFDKLSGIQRVWG